jgi:hypothetical protein
MAVDDHTDDASPPLPEFGQRNLGESRAGLSDRPHATVPFSLA